MPPDVLTTAWHIAQALSLPVWVSGGAGEMGEIRGGERGLGVGSISPWGLPETVVGFCGGWFFRVVL